MSKQDFWKNRKVFITGHTGFKGSWLCLWLYLLGAKVTGYALNPPTKPSLFNLCRIDGLIEESILADIRNLKRLKAAVKLARPEIIIHLAAQPLVRESYKAPLETYAINLMGTVNLLESARQSQTVKAIVNVTTDKVYENLGQKQGYKENEPLGGYDPYSSSKACAEIVVAAYRRSYSMNLATARAGNVIGGGDFAAERLIPDYLRAILKGKEIIIRNPGAVRPWQHVLEALSGYLILAEKLYTCGKKYAGAWNFGPAASDAKPVKWVLQKLGAAYSIDKRKHPHEAACLKLNSAKARKKLGWKSKWNLESALSKILEWTRAYQNKKNLRAVCFSQIEEYQK